MFDDVEWSFGKNIDLLIIFVVDIVNIVFFCI